MTNRLMNSHWRQRLLPSHLSISVRRAWTRPLNPFPHPLHTLRTPHQIPLNRPPPPPPPPLRKPLSYKREAHKTLTSPRTKATTEHYQTAVPLIQKRRAAHHQRSSRRLRSWGYPFSCCSSPSSIDGYYHVADRSPQQRRLLYLFLSIGGGG